MFRKNDVIIVLLICKDTVFVCCLLPLPSIIGPISVKPEQTFRMEQDRLSLFQCSHACQSFCVALISDECGKADNLRLDYSSRHIQYMRLSVITVHFPYHLYEDSEWI